MTVLDMLLRLFNELRDADVDVAMVEVLDAAEALRHLDLADRELLRHALRATLVKHLEDEAVFEVAFERCFPVSRSFEQEAEVARDELPTGLPASSLEPATARTDLLERLVEALRAGDDEALRAIAAEAVDAHAGLGDIDGSERYFLYRVLRALDLAALLSAAMRAERSDGADRGELELRLRRDELAVRIEHFRRLLAQELRHRRPSTASSGATAVSRLDDLDVLRASTLDLRQLRQEVRPLARKLAARIAQRRRRAHAGRLDARRTARRSLAFGGVPIEAAFRHRRRSKPQVVVLCDLSGSMAEFATFTLGLVHALHAELAGLRTFGFVDGVAEVTSVLDRAEGQVEVLHLLSRTGVVIGDGHSDYGNVFEQFWERQAAGAVGPSTTVIVAGDARTNHRPAGLEPFRQLCAKAKRVYWLNPEPRADWDTTDSVMSAYAASCTQVFEVRTLRQLGDAVAEIV